MSQKIYQSKVKGILDFTFDSLYRNPLLNKNDIYSRMPLHLRENVGGNTTCLFVRSRSGRQVVFDMGTGIRELGNDLAGQAFSEGLDLSIFMTHTHWDHIQGWPFFKPAYSPKVNVHFYSCIPNLRERLERQQWDENFPLALDLMASNKEFTLLKEFEEITLGDIHITPFYLKHPGSCTGYKIREGDETIVFATDVEFRPDEIAQIDHLKEKLGKVDAIIIDAQYSTDEAEKKIGWGHTSVRMAVDVAEKWGTERVYLTHFEPDHDDEVIYSIIEKEIDGKDFSLEIIPAREGMKIPDRKNI